MPKVQLDGISNELTEIFKNFLHTSFEKRQEALQAGAEVYVNLLENAAPRDTGEFAKSFKIKTKYKDRRYVGNTKTVNGGGKNGIPLSNILEYGKNSKHYGFMRQTYDNNEQAIFDAIKNKLNN